MRRRVAFAAFSVAVLIAAYLVICAIMAERLARVQRIAVARTPAEFGLTFENVRFNSAVDNLALAGWYIDSPGERVIVLMHGMNGRRDGGVNLDVANELVQRNYDVLMFDFRGHGESGGEYLGLGLLETRDLAGALNFLKTRGVNEVGALGFSMGAVTALNAAPRHPEIRALVADSPFADVNPLLEERLPQASGLPPFFTRGMYLMYALRFGADLTQNVPAQAVARLGNRPLLLIHGTADELVPLEHAYMHQRAAAGNPNFELWIVPNVQHTQAYRQTAQEYARRVLSFFDKYLP